MHFDWRQPGALLRRQRDGHVRQGLCLLRRPGRVVARQLGGASAARQHPLVPAPATPAVRSNTKIQINSANSDLILQAHEAPLGVHIYMHTGILLSC